MFLQKSDVSDQSSRNSDTKNNIGPIMMSLLCAVSNCRLNSTIMLLCCNRESKLAKIFLLKEKNILASGSSIQSLFRVRLMLSEMAGLLGFVNC